MKLWNYKNIFQSIILCSLCSLQDNKIENYIFYFCSGCEQNYSFRNLCNKRGRCLEELSYIGWRRVDGEKDGKYVDYQQSASNDRHERKNWVHLKADIFFILEKKSFFHQWGEIFLISHFISSIIALPSFIITFSLIISSSFLCVEIDSLLNYTGKLLLSEDVIFVFNIWLLY